MWSKGVCVEKPLALGPTRDLVLDPDQVRHHHLVPADQLPQAHALAVELLAVLHSVHRQPLLRGGVGPELEEELHGGGEAPAADVSRHVQRPLRTSDVLGVDADHAGVEERGEGAREAVEDKLPAAEAADHRVTPPVEAARVHDNLVLWLCRVLAAPVPDELPAEVRLVLAAQPAVDAGVPLALLHTVLPVPEEPGVVVLEPHG
eukprot:CAMPEP_0202845914 /NCGR_PEP_ID=MMETSP1389-20130828/71238_1 /ASSEMBLY_ACC=CAM_ASM_000865 /TAXON_ID=302021 /ORGANISM="Rhodomonas sp., Strain CCMP768" /LENGTH=203 /DNA_ID=CAMNT_0049523413 /DNA_START=12 /DNA_END=620 /DNA_ORIENTATION=-